MLASMRRQKKMRPAGITFAAKASLPMRERSSRLVHLCLERKALRSERREESLSCGTHAIWATVSSSMPKNVMQVVGEVCFSGFV